MRIISIMSIILATTLLVSINQDVPTIESAYDYNGLTLITYNDDTCGVNDMHGSCDTLNEMINDCVINNVVNSQCINDYIKNDKVMVIDDKMMDNYTAYIMKRMNL